MARTRHERATDAPVHAADTIDNAKALHDLLAVYFAALASLKAPPPKTPLSGLNALVYWQEYFANPDHLLPQDTPFVRGQIWS
jgi:hypothetical protein